MYKEKVCKICEGNGIIINEEELYEEKCKNCNGKGIVEDINIYGYHIERV